MKGLIRRAARPGLIVAILLLGNVPHAAASGPFPPWADFWFDYRPSTERDDYLAGDLGIVNPQLPIVYLFIAYRHLSGLGLAGADLETVRDFWKVSGRGGLQYGAESGPQRWLRVRRRVTKIDPPYSAYPVFRERVREVDGRSRHAFYANCLEDAFESAARTLEERIADSGAEADEVAAWVAAQDQVFSNCTAGRVIPESLDAWSRPRAQADRDYQIAAAHFYAEEYEEARLRFAAIASDTASPWRHLGDYLVARTWIRQASLIDDQPADSLSRAAEHLEGLMREPARVPVHEAARSLLQFVRLRLDPEAERARLAAGLSASQMQRMTGQDLFDYLWVYRRGALNGGEELTDWLRLATGSRPARDRERALERWRRLRSLPWLVSMLWDAEASSPESEALLAAAGEVPSNSPAFPTARFHHARLLYGLNRDREAETVLGELLELEDPRLALADRNRVLDLLTRNAKSFDQFVRHAQKVPVDVGYSDGRGPLFSFESLPDLETGPLLDWYPNVTINRHLTFDQLLRLLAREELDRRTRRRLAFTVWTRAVVLDREDVAVAAAPRVKELVPELTTEMDLYLASRPGRARRFTAALTILRHPGLRPTLRFMERLTPLAERPIIRDNWWCSGDLEYPLRGAEGGRRLPPPPAFLTREEREAAAAVWERMRQLRDAANHLGPVVLDWARQEAADDRLPEALHRVIQVTRYGCHTGDFGEISRAAFDLLHRRYPRSPWTARTPYWYR